MRTLKPSVSNIVIISLSLGPICLSGNSSLCGNKGSSGLGVVKHLTPFNFGTRCLARNATLCIITNGQ